jgi:hypothetical protein
MHSYYGGLNRLKEVLVVGECLILLLRLIF